MRFVMVKLEQIGWEDRHERHQAGKGTEEGIKKKRCKFISSKGLFHGKITEKRLLGAEVVG
jgi:hypothetical protein